MSPASTNEIFPTTFSFVNGNFFIFKIVTHISWSGDLLCVQQADNQKTSTVNVQTKLQRTDFYVVLLFIVVAVWGYNLFVFDCWLVKKYV